MRSAAPFLLLALAVACDDKPPGTDGDDDDSGSPGETGATFTSADGQSEFGTSVAFARGLGVAVGAPAATSGKGVVYLFSEDAVGEVDAADALATIVGDTSEDGLGTALAVADLDADGTPDLVVGVPGSVAVYSPEEGSTVTAEHGGNVAVFFGPLTGTRALSEVDLLVAGESSGDRAGTSVSWIGDTDGDGHTDLLVGAPEAPGGQAAGRVYLVRGPLSGDRPLAQEPDAIQGSSGDRLGYRVAPIGDHDGDGLADLGLAAVGDDSEGHTYVFRGPASSTVLADAETHLEGTVAGDAAFHLAGAGDVDGDGRDDLVVGAPGTSGGGAAYIVLGGVDITVDDRLVDRADRSLSAGDSGGAFGTGPAGGGDLDGDGDADVLVGDYLATRQSSQVGGVHVFLGPISASSGDPLADSVLWGESDSGWFGWSGAGGVDIDGDGRDDVLVGAPRAASATLSTRLPEQ